MLFIYSTRLALFIHRITSAKRTCKVWPALLFRESRTQLVMYSLDTPIRCSTYIIYHSVPGKCPLPGKCPCSAFQGVNVTASIQTYGNYIPDKRPCGPKLLVMFKCPWALTRDTTVFTNFSYLRKVYGGR